MPVFIVMLGAPGAGKGTQADLISEKYNIPHVSSGAIFRENFKNKTDLGITAEVYISRGDLVPDDITIAMIRERLSREDCARGAVLDGFPRTPAQAEALDKMLLEFEGEVNVVPYIKVDANILLERLTGRWTCRAEGHIFHEIYNPPKEASKCDFDGSELYQRKDDRAETVTKRINVYHEQTAPLIDYFREQGLIAEIDGAQPIEQVTVDLIAVLPQIAQV